MLVNGLARCAILLLNTLYHAICRVLRTHGDVIVGLLLVRAGFSLEAQVEQPLLARSGGRLLLWYI